MSVIIKKFENKELNVSIDTYVDNKQNVWFKGKDVAMALGYERPRNALSTHVDDKYKVNYQNLKGASNQGPLGNHQPHTIFIQEPGLYSLIFGSKLETAKVFQDWVFSKVLPSIRKYGYYKMFNNPNTLTFKIEDEYDLHTKVVQFIRRFYPNAIMSAGLGELQDTKNKRIDSFKKGYMKGQPDLIIQNLHKQYSGVCIEFKTPQCNGVLSDQQKDLIELYEENGYKSIVSNDYDLITKELNDYMRDIRIKCKYCRRKFISKKTIKRHVKYFHRIK